MIKPVSKLTITDGSVKAAKSFVDLAKLQVYVGIPESDGARKSPGVTNAQLAFIHTHGARTADFRSRMGATMKKKAIAYPVALQMYLHSYGNAIFHIPPRPIIEPAIEASGNKKLILAELKKAATAALVDNKSGAITSLKRAGLTAQNLVRAWFTDPRNNWAPNAPSTIKRKKSDKPLIDTGELRKSITYVVADGGQEK
jgi:hypothetical protein